MNTAQGFVDGSPVGVSAMPFNAAQRALWRRKRAASLDCGQVRAFRLTGAIDDDRLMAAATEVVAAFDTLHLTFTDLLDGPLVTRTFAPPPHYVQLNRDLDLDAEERDRQCLVALEARRGQVSLADVSKVEVTVVRTRPDEVVLAVAGDPLVVDTRSLHLLLGAVMQAYFDRFRPAEYPTYAAAARTVAGDVVPATRLAWWSRQLEHWGRNGWPDRPDSIAVPSTYPAPLHTAPRHDAQLALDHERWRRLCSVSEHAGNTGSLAVVALLSWWARGRAPEYRAVYQTTLDLREYYGLGPVVGPLTDSIAFAVDLTGVEDLTLRDLVHRAHAGLLDSVVRYVPFEALRHHGREHGIVRPPWDVLVHYCRTPPTSATTRGEETLARRGLSIELFREADLARLGVHHDSGDAALEVDLAEHADGVVLLVRADTSRVAPADVDEMLGDLDRFIDVVIDAPTIALAKL